MPADCAGLAIVLPAGSSEVAADDALDGEHLEALTDHRAAVVAEIEKMVGDEVASASEPEGRQSRQDAPLVRDRCRQHDVERRDAVARDEREGDAVERVELTHLPAREVRGRLVDHAPTSSGTSRAGTRANTV